MSSTRSSPKMPVYYHSSPPVPKIIDHYSLTGGEFVFRDYRCLRVIKPGFNKSCRMNLNLLQGLDVDTYINAPPKVRHLLIHLAINGVPRDPFNQPRDRRPIPFNVVTSRGLLVDVITSSLAEYGAEIVVEKFKHTTYIYRHYDDETPNDGTKNQASGDVAQMKFTYGGEYFEEIATRPYSCAQRNDATGVGEGRDHFYCVFSNRIGQFSVLYSGEMDALRDEKCNVREPRNYFELKTKSETILHQNANPIAVKKFFLQLWAQCALSGIEEAILGYRDSNTICRQLVNYRVEDLPAKYDFDAGAQMATLESFLNFVRSLMQFKRDGEKLLITLEAFRAHDEASRKCDLLSDSFKRRFS